MESEVKESEAGGGAARRVASGTPGVSRRPAEGPVGVDRVVAAKAFVSPLPRAGTCEREFSRAAPGVAFGAALAGGAIAGPMGAFMALPVAAWVTSFIKEFSHTYPLVYRSR